MVTTLSDHDSILNATKPKPLPPFLYKYRSLTATARAFTFSLLEKTELYYPKPRELNDPNDMRVKFDIRIPGCPPLDFNNLKDPLVAALHREFESARDELGICCFSEIPDDPAMWAHYADSHRGICIGFDTSTDPGWNNVAQVRYSNETPVLRIEPGYSAQRSDLAFQQTKALSWSYEKEWRFIQTMGNNPRAVHLPAKTLTRVILGCQTSEEDQKMVIQALARRSNKVEVFQARQMFGEYSLSIVPI